MLRNVVGLTAVLVLTACPPPSRVAEPSPSASSRPVLEDPAPLPPEETPSAEPPAPSDPPNAKPVEPGITATGAPTRGKLPKAVIDGKLKEAQPGIAACYDRALKAKPELRGVVNVDFVVSTEGKVVHVAAASADDELPDEGAVRCILAEIEKLVFPLPVGGRVFVNYPIALEPPRP